MYSAEQKGKEAKGTDARERANLFSIAAHGAFLPNVWRAAPCHPPPDPLYGLLLCEVLPIMPAEAGGEGVNGASASHAASPARTRGEVPELRRRLYVRPG